MALANGKSAIKTGPVTLHTETAIHMAELLTEVMIMQSLYLRLSVVERGSRDYMFNPCVWGSCCSEIFSPFHANRIWYKKQLCLLPLEEQITPLKSRTHSLKIFFLSRKSLRNRFVLIEISYTFLNSEMPVWTVRLRLASHFAPTLHKTSHKCCLCVPFKQCFVFVTWPNV